jgi:hypothetical protein
MPESLTEKSRRHSQRISHRLENESFSSCPALCRASTSLSQTGKKGVDGRVRPGHDEFGAILAFRDQNALLNRETMAGLP